MASKLLLIVAVALLFISVAFTEGNKDKKGELVFDQLYKTELKDRASKQGKKAYEDDDEEESHADKKKHKPADEGRKHGEHKGKHEEYENNGYGNPFGEVREREREREKQKDSKFLSKTSRIFKFCSFSAVDCSSTPSCFVVQNAKCFALPNGDSVKIDLTGTVGSAYYFAGVVNCSSVTPTFYLDKKIDACFPSSDSSVGLSFSNLNF